MKKFVYVLVGLIVGLIIVQVIVYFASTSTPSIPVVPDVKTSTEVVSPDVIAVMDEPIQAIDVPDVEKVTPTVTNASEDLNPVYEAPLHGDIILN